MPTDPESAACYDPTECTESSPCPACEAAGMRREYDRAQDREDGSAQADAVGAGGDR